LIDAMRGIGSRLERTAKPAGDRLAGCDSGCAGDPEGGQADSGDRSTMAMEKENDMLDHLRSHLPACAWATPPAEHGSLIARETGRDAAMVAAPIGGALIGNNVARARVVAQS
jgi:hypothetical protein